MSYQLCRWYDPYPRLAFALKLLYLSPARLQARAARALERFMDEEWGTPYTERTRYEASSRLNGKRWYDELLETAIAVELIKNSPEHLKSRVADTLLAILDTDAADVS